MASLSERSEVGDLFDQMTLGVAKTLGKQELCLPDSLCFIFVLEYISESITVLNKGGYSVVS